MAVRGGAGLPCGSGYVSEKTMIQYLITITQTGDLELKVNVAAKRTEPRLMELELEKILDVFVDQAILHQTEINGGGDVLRKDAPQNPP